MKNLKKKRLKIRKYFLQTQKRECHFQNIFYLLSGTEGFEGCRQEGEFSASFSSNRYYSMDEKELTLNLVPYTCVRIYIYINI